MKEEKIELVDQIMTALQKVIDPELQVDIVNLGLIYGIDIEGTKATVKNDFDDQWLSIVYLFARPH